MHNGKIIAPLETVDGKSLLVPPLKFTIEEILPQGLFILAGSPKIGKSWLSLDFCQTVATGGQIWDYHSEQREGLYLALEDRLKRLQDRFRYYSTFLMPIYGKFIQKIGDKKIMLAGSSQFMVQWKTGLAPLEAEKEKSSLSQMQTKEMTFSESMKTLNFWLLTIALFFINFFASATNTHSAPYFSDLGYSTAIVSLMMLLITVGKIVLGYIYDQYDATVGNLVVCISSLCFPAFALLSLVPVFPWMYAVSIGMSSCVVSVPVTILIGRYWGQRDFPSIFSFFSMLTALAPSVSVPAMGAVFDITGSYRLAWIILLGLSVIITVCLMGAEANFRYRKTT